MTTNNHSTPTPEELAAVEESVREFMQAQQAVPKSERIVISSEKYDGQIREPAQATSDADVGDECEGVWMTDKEPQNAEELFDWLATVSGGWIEISQKKPFNIPLDPTQEVPLTQEGISRFLREYVWDKGGYKNCEDAIQELALCLTRCFEIKNPLIREISLTEHTKRELGF